jgi:hypothetical protein
MSEPTHEPHEPDDLGSRREPASILKIPDDLDDGELILGLDWSSHLCGIASRFPEHDTTVPELCAEHLRLVAEELCALELVLVTFVAPDRLTPTAADVARFEGLRVECRAVEVELVDHLLMSGHRWRAIAELTPLFSRRQDGDHAA